MVGLIQSEEMTKREALMAHQYIRSPEWDRRFEVSIEADVLGGQEHWLPRGAEILELGPNSVPVGNILRLSRSLRYIHDSSGARPPGKPDNVVIFACMANGQWMPALLIHAEPQRTLGQELGEAWKARRLKKREKNS